MSERLKKINALIKKELGKIILKEIDLPRTVLLTIIEVETSRDLRESKVFISVFPEKNSREILWVLEREIYNLQQILNKSLRMRPVPKIKFLKDKKFKRAQEIDKILRKIED
ncbi:MAG: 30S ribosome-binding factor RbfA [Patescibacteria group bacterium]|nr:30S ribosome-binding factor RbfA [Patescibacteria group bacterium]